MGLGLGLGLFQGGLDVVQEGLGFGEGVGVGGYFGEGGVEEELELGLQGEDGVEGRSEMGTVVVAVRVVVKVGARIWVCTAGWIERGYHWDCAEGAVVVDEFGEDEEV